MWANCSIRLRCDCDDCWFYGGFAVVAGGVVKFFEGGLAGEIELNYNSKTNFFLSLPYKNIMMKGVSFVTDETHNRRYAQIDLKDISKFDNEEFQDMLDIIIAESRRNEKSIPWAKVKADLVKEGKRKGWEQAFKEMAENGDDALAIPDVFNDENTDDWTWK